MALITVQYLQIKFLEKSATWTVKKLEKNTNGKLYR